MAKLKEEKEERKDLKFNSDIFFDVFPFHMVFNTQMVITNIGSGLESVIPHILGQAVDEMFTLNRPLVEFSMDNVRDKYLDS